MKSILRHFAVILTLFIAEPVFAQDAEVINSSRPRLSSGPNGVGVGYFQIETGLDTILRHGDDNKSSATLDTQIRYGFSEQFEMNAMFDVREDRFKTRSRDSGVSEADVGGRFTLLPRSDGLLPAIGVVVRLKLHMLGTDYRRDDPVTTLMIATEHDLAKETSLRFNFGNDYDDSSAKPVYPYVATITHRFTDHVLTFIEAFGEFDEDDVGSVSAHTGLGWALNNDFQLDLSAGWGRNQGVSETLVTAGVSWRTLTRADRP